MTLKYRIVSCLLIFMGLLQSCEEAFIPDTPPPGDEIVVEGYVEAGESPAPAFVLLTRSMPFYGEVNPEIISELFIEGAEVSISDGADTVSLTEVCLEDLPEELRKLIRQQMGTGQGLNDIPICAYVDLQDRLNREIGEKYRLWVQTDGQQLTAATTIPQHVPPDSITLKKPPDVPGDSFYQMIAHIDDPGGVKNYYRYFSRSRDGPYQAPFVSVTDDAFFDGEKFSFPLHEAESINQIDTNELTFGLVEAGDTIEIKWTNIDEDHFNFWNTLEFNRSNQGPFSTYTLADSNIEGGLGIFGGYSVSFHRIIVAE